MAEIPKDVDEIEEGAENILTEQAQVSASKKKISPKVLLGCIIGLVFLVLCTGGWFLYKHFSSSPEEKKNPQIMEEGKDTIPQINCFISIPEVVVNLRSNKPKGNILRTTLVLQIYSKEDEQKIKEFTPIILDQTLSYLRDQSVNDLEGPGLERMRQAILLRINNIIRPLKIYRVILKDFIIQ
jgi:flagellar basal body-associated protein FliL